MLTSPLLIKHEQDGDRIYQPRDEYQWQKNKLGNRGVLRFRRMNGESRKKIRQSKQQTNRELYLLKRKYRIGWEKKRDKKMGRRRLSRQG